MSHCCNLSPHRYGQRYGWLLRTNFRRTLTLQQVGWALVGLGANYRCDSTLPSLKAVSRPVQAACLALALATLHSAFILPPTPPAEQRNKVFAIIRTGQV